MIDRRHVLGFAGALVTTALIPSAAHALGTTLTVTVTGKQGKPAAGATVRVYMGTGEDGDPLKFIGEGKTNDKGVVKFVVIDDVEGQKFLVSANNGEYKGQKTTKAKTGKSKARVKMVWPA